MLELEEGDRGLATWVALLGGKYLKARAPFAMTPQCCAILITRCCSFVVFNLPLFARMGLVLGVGDQMMVELSAVIFLDTLKTV